MIPIICEFLGVNPPTDEVALIVGVALLIYMLSEFMSFTWAIYKAVFRRG